MIKFKDELEQRAKYLENVIRLKRNKLKECEQIDTIYTRKHGSGFQYYMKGQNGIKYIRNDNFSRVKSIVQSEYDRKVLKTAEQEYKRILKLLAVYKDDVVEDVFESMPEGKQKVVITDIISDKKFAEEWSREKYEPLGFKEGYPEYYSAKGERMRSKSEVIIANLLDQMHVEYKYEKPIKLKRLGLVHPDFTLLKVSERKEIYLEHLGMLDDQTYRNNAIVKIRDYESSGYFLGDRLIVTSETANSPLDVKCVERKIKHILDIK